MSDLLHGVTANASLKAVQAKLAISSAPATGHSRITQHSIKAVAIGNFLKTDVDLDFTDGDRNLLWTRTYDSFNTHAGAFGIGWSSWAEARLTFTADCAHMRHETGQISEFRRLGDGWERATGEKLWLRRADNGFRVDNHDGATWDYTADGRVHRTAAGPGTEIAFAYNDAGRLSRLTNMQGSLDVTWRHDRIVALTSADGRSVLFEYDNGDHLSSADGEHGIRTYVWTGSLITRIMDAKGVVEVENTYDGQRRISHQRAGHGWVIRFTYLAGPATVVSIGDGHDTRSFAWLHDSMGRLTSVVDFDERRQSMSYDSFGNLLTLTERDGAVTVHEYDELGRRVRTVTSTGQAHSFGYDALDRLTLAVGESGAVTEFRYEDTNRRPSVILDSDGSQTQFIPDDAALTEAVDLRGVGVQVAAGADDNTSGVERNSIARGDALGTPADQTREKPARQRAAVMGLLVVTVAWASTFIVLAHATMRVPAADYVFVRFAMATLALVAMRPIGLITMPREVRRHAVLLGLAFGSGNLLLTAGLAYTAASTSGFITGMNVVFTPVFCAVLFRDRIGRNLWTGVTLAATGLGVLSLTGGHSFGIGELMTLVGAVPFSLQIIGLSKWSSPKHTIEMATIQAGMTALVGLVFAWPDGISLPTGRSEWLLLAYMAFGVTVVTMLVLTWAQSRLEPARAAVVMTLEPVWAALFAVVLGGEPFTWRLGLGGLLILSAMFLCKRD